MGELHVQAFLFVLVQRIEIKESRREKERERNRMKREKSRKGIMLPAGGGGRTGIDGFPNTKFFSVCPGMFFPASHVFFSGVVLLQ